MTKPDSDLTRTWDLTQGSLESEAAGKREKILQFTKKKLSFFGGSY